MSEKPSVVKKIMERNQVELVKESTAALVDGKHAQVPEITCRWARKAMQECSRFYMETEEGKNFDMDASVIVDRVMYQGLWQPSPKPLNDAGKKFLRWIAREML